MLPEILCDLIPYCTRLDLDRWRMLTKQIRALIHSQKRNLPWHDIPEMKLVFDHASVTISARREGFAVEDSKLFNVRESRDAIISHMREAYVRRLIVVLADYNMAHWAIFDEWKRSHWRLDTKVGAFQCVGPTPPTIVLEFLSGSLKVRHFDLALNVDPNAEFFENVLVKRNTERLSIRVTSWDLLFQPAILDSALSFRAMKCLALYADCDATAWIENYIQAFLAVQEPWKLPETFVSYARSHGLPASCANPDDATYRLPDALNEFIEQCPRLRTPIIGGRLSDFHNPATGEELKVFIWRVHSQKVYHKFARVCFMTTKPANAYGWHD